MTGTSIRTAGKKQVFSFHSKLGNCPPKWHCVIISLSHPAAVLTGLFPSDYGCPNICCHTLDCDRDVLLRQATKILYLPLLSCKSTKRNKVYVEYDGLICFPFFSFFSFTINNLNVKMVVAVIKTYFIIYYYHLKCINHKMKSQISIFPTSHFMYHVCYNILWISVAQYTGIAITLLLIFFKYNFLLVQVL